MFTIGEKLKQMESSVPWAKAASKIHADRWEYIHSDFHAAGYALDPEFLETVGDLDAATQDGLLNVIERLCLREAMLEALENGQDYKSIKVTDKCILDRVCQTEQELARYQEREGPFTRPSVIANAKTMPPSTWWQMYGKHLPLLSKFACIVLAQPAAASIAERNWSVYGQIKSERRTRLKHATADKLVYCHESLAMMRKVRDAGYAAEVERWQSDSDSDRSSVDEDENADMLRLMA